MNDVRARIAFRLGRLLRERIRPLLQMARVIGFLGLDSLCKGVPRPSGPSTVIIIRLDAVGDFFIWLQSGAADISRYARQTGLRPVLLANAAWADYARRMDLWDCVIPVQPARLMLNPLYRLRLMAKVRRLGVELLIQPRAARVFLQEDAIARISGAPRRIGNGGTFINMDGRLRQLGNRCYTELIKVDESRQTHELERNNQFVLGLTGKPATRLDLPLPSKTQGSRTVVVALGAGQIGRVWPLEKLAALLEHLRSHHPDLRIILVGVPADLSMAGRLRSLVGDSLENRVGTTQLHEYADLIADSTLTICNDSSAYHIAMAFERKVLCFLGGGHYGWFAPYPATMGAGKAVVLSVPMSCFWCNWECRYPRAPGGSLACVASIPVDDAINAVETLLIRGTTAINTRERYPTGGEQASQAPQ